MEMFDASLMIIIAGVLHAGVLKAAPLLWATLGGAFSERSGVINIGLEGMMLVGAFAAVAGSGLTGSPWIGVLGAALCGALFGLLHAWISLFWKADQIVSGMGINLLALGITGFALFAVFDTRGNSPEVAKIPAFSVEETSSWWQLLIFPFSPTHILLGIILVVSIYLFYQTRYGLRLRACGENPAVVKAAGINVAYYRYSAVTLSGMLAGLGGAQLSIGDISQFSVGMTNGRGFIALAALICSGWRPGRAALVCIFFGVMEAMSESLQSFLPGLPSRAMLALPFVLALIVLALSYQKSQAPKALGEV